MGRNATTRWLARLRPRGSSTRDGRSILVQVKTASPGRRAFQVKTAHETLTGQTNQWFVFVRFHHDESLRPTFHLAPRNVVAAILWTIRREAEARGKTVGGWRNFLTDWLDDSCQENWGVLLDPTDQARVFVRSQVSDIIRSLGRPEDQTVISH